MRPLCAAAFAQPMWRCPPIICLDHMLNHVYPLTTFPLACAGMQAQPGSFDAAVAGCDAVVHCASPYSINPQPGRERQSLVEPAVQGR